MEQPTPTKPVMDVMPPKPAATAVLPPTDVDTGPAAHGDPSSANTANAASTGSLPTASPATDAGKDSLTVHQAPPLTDEDKAPADSSAENAAQPEHTAAAHTAPAKPRGPAAAITLVVLGMVLLSSLAILVYLNS